MVADTGFPTIPLGVMAARYDAMDGGMSCMISRSSDSILRERALRFLPFSVLPLNEREKKGKDTFFNKLLPYSEKTYAWQLLACC